MSQAIGIDFGGTTIKSGVVENGKIIDRSEPIPTQALGGPAAIVEALVELVGRFRDHGKIAAVGIGLPGLVDSRNGIVHELTNVAGWVETPLRQILQDRTGFVVTVENDAKAMAYGEWKHGAARNGNDIVCLTLGTGVGGALILDGRLYRGAQLAAGEIGHMSIDYRGRPGPYGNFGCLEEYIGNSQIAQRAAERYRAAGQERAAADCSPRKLSEAANAGDPIAKQMWEDIGDELGAALASVVWIINPDTIVIGGGVAKAGELILDPVRRSIRSRTLDIVNEKIRIVPAELGNDAGIIGNATLALEAAGLS
jgi:glucokinase